MSFVHPWALLLLLGVPVVLWLHLFGRAAGLRLVSSINLWRHMSELRGDASRARRLSPRTFLQAGIITAGALGAAEPLWNAGAQGGSLVIVLDTSASMAAAAGRTTRFAEAVDEVRRILDDSGPDAKVTLLTVARSARVETNGSSKADAWSVVTRTRPVPEAGDLDAGVRLATDLARTGSGGRVAVVSDFQDQGRTKSVASAGAPVSLHRVGRPVDNVAVARLSVGRGEASSAYAGIVEFASFSGKAEDLPWSVLCATGEVAAGRIDLQPRQRAVRKFSLPRGAGGPCEARIESRDALSIDDRRAAVIQAENPIRVAWLADPRPFLRAAVLAGGRTRIVGAGEPHELVISHGCPPDMPCLEARATDDGRPALVTGRAPHGGIPAPWREGDQFEISRAERLVLPETASALLTDPAGVVAYQDETRTGERQVVLGFDTEGTGFTLDPAFPVFIQRALAWLAARAGAGEQLEVGRPTRIHLGGIEDGRLATVVGSDGKAEGVRVDRGAVLFVPRTAGVFEVRAGASHRSVAVGFPVEEESDLAREPAEPLALLKTTGGPPSVVRSVLPLGRALLLVTALLVIIDSTSSRRLWRRDRPR